MRKTAGHGVVDRTADRRTVLLMQSTTGNHATRRNDRLRNEAEARDNGVSSVVGCIHSEKGQEVINHEQAAMLIDSIAEAALANGMDVRNYRRDDLHVVGAHIDVLVMSNRRTGVVSRTYGRVNGHDVVGNGFDYALAQIVNAAARKAGAL
jgi:hypothetical protein